MKRRTFLKQLSISGAVAATHAPVPNELYASVGKPGPIVLSTWDYGKAVPEKAVKVLKEGGALLDAVEQAVMIPEADPEVTSVGRGGFPDRTGKVTLDASIMDGNGNCGSVVYLEHIVHPISVARLVMERTPHVCLAGSGALEFALAHGFKKENLLTTKAQRAYDEWAKKQGHPVKSASNENHDTIGLLAMNEEGKLAGACTTSGMAWKMRGRVGDSPLIGSGLFVDNEAGAATATGVGEAVIKVAGTAVIVELMRAGKSPQEACRTALERILRKQTKYRDDSGFLVGLIAMNLDGEIGAICYHKGFQYSLYRDGVYSVVDAEHLV